MGISNRDYYQDELPALKPWDRYSMVINLIIANVAIMLANFIFTSRTSALTEFLMLRPTDLWQPLYWFRFVSYGFAHADLPHILFNMLSLYFLGQAVESHYGRWEFLRIYMAMIVVCGIVHAIIAVSGASVGGPVLGASGAVVGVVMLFVYNFPQATLMLWGIVPIKAWVVGVLTVGANFLGNQRNVAYDVHLIGIACATLYFYSQMNFRSFDSLGSLFQSSFKRRPKLRVHTVDEPEPISRDEAEADRLLDKIYREGQNSLTPKEQKFLEQYSRRVREKRNS